MEIIRGKQPGAKKVVIYGPEGIGKSTLAAGFPNPLFIDTEGSTKDMDVARTKAPSSWTMLLGQVKEVITDLSLCKTLIIDTADWAEMLCSNHVCSSNQKTNIEDFGYGKGYIYLQEEFGKLLNLFTDLIDRGINVVLTAHAKMRKFEQPDEMGAYDRWEMKMSKNVAPMVKEWADMVLFCNYKTIVVNVDGQGAQKGKNKAQGGKRVMYTTHHNCWDAKNRYGLPDECDMNYESIRHVIEMPVSTVQEKIEKLAPEAPKETKIPDFMKTPETMDTEVDFNTGTETKTKEHTLPEQNRVPKMFKLPETIPKQLKDLMEANLVSEEEIQKAVASKGYFPENTPIQNYPSEFIDGVLVGVWQQVYGEIKKIRDSYDVPFNK